MYAIDPVLAQKKKQDQTGEDPTQISSSNGTPSGASPQPEASSSTKSDAKTGSGFQSLDSYFNANPNDQTNQKLNAGIQNKIMDAKQAASDVGNQFKTQVDNLNKTPTQQDIQTAIDSGKPVTLGGQGGTVADPTASQGWLTQQYQGPKSLAEAPGLTQNVTAKAQAAGADVNALGSSSGRYALLDEYFGKPTYTAGQKNLDNALLTNANKSAPIGSNLQSQLGGLAQIQNQNIGASAGYAAQKASEIQAAQNAARTAFGIDANGQVITGDGAGELGKDYQAINDRIDQQNLDRNSAYAALTGGGNYNNYSDDLLQQLGISRGENVISSLDLSKYIKQGDPLTVNNVISSDEQNYLNNLAKMAGISPTFAQGDVSAASNPYTIDKAGYQTAKQQVMDNINHDIQTEKDPEYNMTIMEMQNQLNGPPPQVNNNYVKSGQWKIDMQNHLNNLMSQIYTKYGFIPNKTYFTGDPVAPTSGTVEKPKPSVRY